MNKDHIIIGILALVCAALLVKIGYTFNQQGLFTNEKIDIPKQETTTVLFTTRSNCGFSDPYLDLFSELEEEFEDSLEIKPVFSLWPYSDFFANETDLCYEGLCSGFGKDDVERSLAIACSYMIRGNEWTTFMSCLAQCREDTTCIPSCTEAVGLSEEELYACVQGDDVQEYIRSERVVYQHNEIILSPFFLINGEIIPPKRYSDEDREGIKSEYREHICDSLIHPHEFC